MSKYFDIKPKPVTSYEHWQAWLNWVQARLVTMAGKRITVKSGGIYIDPMFETRFWVQHERQLEEGMFGE